MQTVIHPILLIMKAPQIAEISTPVKPNVIRTPPPPPAPPPTVNAGWAGGAHLRYRLPMCYHSNVFLLANGGTQMQDTFFRQVSDSVDFLARPGLVKRCACLHACSTTHGRLQSRAQMPDRGRPTFVEDCFVFPPMLSDGQQVQRPISTPDTNGRSCTVDLACVSQAGVRE